MAELKESRCNNCGFLYKIEKMHYSPKSGFYFCDYCSGAVKEYEIAHNFGIPIDREKRDKFIAKEMGNKEKK